MGELQTTPIGEKMVTFLKPFTGGLWAVIIASILIAGVVKIATSYLVCSALTASCHQVMYFLEADFIAAGGSGDFADMETPVQAMAHSITLAFFLFAGAGGHAPASPTGKLYLVMLLSFAAPVSAHRNVSALQFFFAFTILVTLACYVIQHTCSFPGSENCCVCRLHPWPAF